MERKQGRFDKASVELATTMSKARVESALRAAKKFSTDPDRKARLTAQLCLPCFYGSRMAGQAFTNKPCDCCGEMQTYSSTDTDKLCRNCAVEHSVCRHCSANIG